MIQKVNEMLDLTGFKYPTSAHILICLLDVYTEYYHKLRYLHCFKNELTFGLNSMPNSIKNNENDYWQKQIFNINDKNAIEIINKIIYNHDSLAYIIMKWLGIKIDYFWNTFLMKNKKIKGEFNLNFISDNLILEDSFLKRMINSNFDCNNICIIQSSMAKDIIKEVKANLNFDILFKYITPLLENSQKRMCSTDIITYHPSKESIHQKSIINDIKTRII